MNRLRKLYIALGVLGTLSLPLTEAASKKPNVIIIYTDDHGVTDLGIHGHDSKVDTPTLDKLAAGGALMNAGYASAPKCVPSRAGVITGRIQNEIGVVTNQDDPLPLTTPSGEPLKILPQYLKELGYTTGQIGKWSLGEEEGYFVSDRGFDDYYSGSNKIYRVNFDLEGNSIPYQIVKSSRNRVIVQGEAAEAFIEKNHESPFFLYLALYGPHLPRIEKDDPYYVNFPNLDYPHYSDEMDDIRRQGLALIKAMDDAVAGMMEKLREHGIEEDTLIFYAGDNGGSSKFGSSVIGGPKQLAQSNGSENVPLRGEKGTLWEGGIRVPMFAYWKGTIPAGTVIEEPVWTLDFTATSIIAGGGAPTAEMDGVDLLPRLTAKASVVERDGPLFWDHQPSIAIRKGDWKLQRYNTGDYLFNLADDPLELTNLYYQNPEKHAELKAELMAWRDALPEKGKEDLGVPRGPVYVTGMPEGTPIDPRYKIPYENPVAAPYPAPVQEPGAPAKRKGKKKK